MRLYRKKDTRNWWMCFTIDGVRHDKSTGTTDEKVAGLVLADIELKIFKKERLGVEFELQYTFDEMMSKFMDEYASKQEKSTQRRYNSLLNTCSRSSEEKSFPG